MAGSPAPLLVVGISGKRYAGKDTLAHLLSTYLSADHAHHRFEIFPLASAFKLEYSLAHGLDFNRLMHDREYKEEHRKHMNDFFHKTYPEDPGRFCRAALAHAHLRQAQTLFITDVRLKNDVKHLRKLTNNRVVLIRVSASEEKKRSFGWTFDAQIDLHATETDLDHVQNHEWHRVVENNGTLEDLKRIASEIAHEFVLPPSPPAD